MSLCSLSLWVLLLLLLLLVQSSSLIDQTEVDNDSDDEASKRTDKSLDENAKQVFKSLANEGPTAPEMMKDVLIAKFNLALDDHVREVQSAYKRHNQGCKVTPEEREQITHEIESELKLMNESLDKFENELKKSKIKMNEIDDGFKVKLETLKKDIEYYIKWGHCFAWLGICKVYKNIKELKPKKFSKNDGNDPKKCTPLTPESSDPGTRKMPFFPWFSSVSSKTRDAVKKFLNFDKDGKDSKMNSDILSEEDRGGGGRNTSKVLPFIVAGSTGALMTLFGYILHSNRIQKQDIRNKLANLLKLNDSSLSQMSPHNQQILDPNNQDSNLWNFLLWTFLILLVVAALVFYFLFYKKKKRKIKPMKYMLESSMIGSKRSSKTRNGNKSYTTSQTGQKTKKSKSSSKQSSTKTSRKKTPKSKI